MTLHIPDEFLEAARLDERGMLLELACSLFDSQRLTLWQAARLAGLDRTSFEEVLHQHKIPIYRLDEREFDRDLRTLEK